jgi:hypothetical protein
MACAGECGNLQACKQCCAAGGWSETIFNKCVKRCKDTYNFDTTIEQAEAVT